VAGGQPGRSGANRVIRNDGAVVELPGSTRVEVEPGDMFEIETPGGGGYGATD
jgi:5-oxoprolinase (ATP-hydrolysing)